MNMFGTFENIGINLKMLGEILKALGTILTMFGKVLKMLENTEHVEKIMNML